MAQDLWVEKYRPTELADYIFQNENDKNAILAYIKEGTIPHMMFSGVQGTGKTTLARLLVKLLEVEECDKFRINASNQNNVEVVRERIDAFTRTSPLGKFKVVILEEADRMTLGAQDAMKDMFEENASSCRFILTTNKPAKIIPPIRSRCQHFMFGTLDRVAMTESAATILIKENVEFELDTLDRFVEAGYPDMRFVINCLQKESKTGKLVLPDHFSELQDCHIEVLGLMKAGDWSKVVSYCKKSVPDDAWEDMFKVLYENLDLSPKFKKHSQWSEAIVIIADHLYKHAFVSDRGINGVAMMVRLGAIV